MGSEVMYKNVDGKKVRMTDEEIAEFEAFQASFSDVPVIDPNAPSTSVIAAAELGTAGGEITGIEGASGIGFAMMVMDGVFWLFFNSPQPDVKYMPFVQSPDFDVDVRVTDRQTDYLEVTARSRATNEPVIPAGFAITVQRTQ